MALGLTRNLSLACLVPLLVTVASLMLPTVDASTVRWLSGASVAAWYSRDGTADAAVVPVVLLAAGFVLVVARVPRRSVDR